MNISRCLILSSFLVCLLSCQKQEDRPPLPVNMHLDNNEARFAVDTNTSSHEFYVRGTPDMIVKTDMTNKDGQRSFRLIQKNSSNKDWEHVIAKGHWNLPPVSSMNSKGYLLICWNHLPGEDSEITRGKMPDPRDGVNLFCHLRNENGFVIYQKIRIGSVELGSGKFPKVAWLRDVLAHRDGTFHISFYVEHGWFGPPSLSEHGYYLQVLDPKKTFNPLKPAIHLTPDCLNGQLPSGTNQ